jgi:hypothetical protein
VLDHLDDRNTYSIMNMKFSAVVVGALLLMQTGLAEKKSKK